MGYEGVDCIDFHIAAYGDHQILQKQSGGIKHVLSI